MKIKLNNISETMLITLHARAKDAESKNPILNDKKSSEILSQLDYDFSKFLQMSWFSPLSFINLDLIRFVNL